MISSESLEAFLKEGRIRPSPQFVNFMRVAENANYTCESVLETLLDEMLLGIAFNVHYEAKKGFIDVEEEKVEEKLEENKNTDIFGEPIMQKKTQKCVCPTCKHSLAASRFAPHLAKCLGLGRISSRIASRRIANNSKESGYGGLPSDDEDDADWTAGPDRRRRKRDKNGTRRPRTQKWSREGEAAEEKRGLLVSEQVRKRCPQPQGVRAVLQDGGDVDVDTYEEGDAQSMRESLGRAWEHENSNTSSPADSASTSSSSSKKRDKQPKVKSKNTSKNHKGSPTVLTSIPSLGD
ncbi:hypothetical protein PR048_003300 [Dryococelus australis]|uniref:SAGA-associated factor 11 n=1 Tax=Dryococelus australis TaxID=614101 RepID=A0ABQ9IMP5_9NEOP|nr:hypothetical protein PR048_003300 [Dryococelus australis]